MKLLPVLLFALLPLTALHAGPETDTLNLGARMRPVEPAMLFESSEWHRWCNSVIRGEDGKYHLFYARWPRSAGFPAWLTGCEVAHAVSDHSNGPWKELGTVLAPSTDDGWDKATIHNVKVRKFDGKYYLYYMSANHPKYNDPKIRAEIGRRGGRDPRWMPLRNTQRIGAAVADSVYGPWKRLKQPMVQPHGSIRTIVNNPDVCLGPDGKYRLIAKGLNVNSRANMAVIQAIGTGDTPVGPWKIRREPAFADMPTEDATLWYDAKRARYYAIAHAFGKNYIVLITSEDGMHWKQAAHAKVCDKEIRLTDGRVLKGIRLERPEVLVEDGEVRQLSFAYLYKGRSGIVFFPLTRAGAGAGDRE